MIFRVIKFQTYFKKPNDTLVQYDNNIGVKDDI